MEDKQTVLLGLAPLSKGCGVRVSLVGPILAGPVQLSPEEARILADALVDIAELAETYDNASKFTPLEAGDTPIKEAADQ